MTDPSVEPEPEQEPDSSSTPDPRADGEPSDAVYFVLNEGPKGYGGLVRLAGGKFERVSDSGSRFVQTRSGSRLLAGMAPPSRSWFRELGSPSRVDIDPGLGWVQGIDSTGDRVSVLGLQGVGDFLGGQWSVTPRTKIGSNLRDLIIDAAGVVWVLSGNAVFRKSDDAFVSVGPPGTVRFRRFLRGPGDAIAVMHDRGVIARAGDGWVDVKTGSPPTASLSAAVFRADGTLLVAQGATLYATKENKHRSVPLSDLGLTVRSVSVLAADAGMRTWMSTEAGLFVLSKEFDRIVGRWPRGSERVLRGGIRAIHPVGGPVSLPAPGRVDGHVVGRVVQKGKPVANTTIELCAEPIRGDLGSMGSPCEAPSVERPFTARTRTRPDGTFELWEIPPEPFAIAVQISGTRWHVTPSGSVLLANETR